MTVRFIDTRDRQCRTPVSGTPGPDMLVCGAETPPGRSDCPACRKRLYYRPTKTQIKAIDATAGRPFEPTRRPA